MGANGNAQPFGGYPSKTAYAIARHEAGATISQVARELGISRGTAHQMIFTGGKAAQRNLVWDQEAARRGMSRSALRKRLLDIICDDDLFDAILDEEVRGVTH